MQNNKKIYHVIPLNLKLRIFATRCILICENLAKTVFYILFLLVVFISLSLLNFFSILSYWVHFFVLFIFLGFLILILLNMFKYFKWPSINDCARRIELDNDTKHRPISVVYDKPGINSESSIWAEHYNNMLSLSVSLKRIKLRSTFSKIDPLFIRLPIVLLFLFIYFAHYNVLTDRVEAAILPQIEIADDSKKGIFTGWLTPPEYTKRLPILLLNSEGPVSIPHGSILSARVHGGKGETVIYLGNEIKEFIKIDDENSSIESIIETDVDLSIVQNENVLFNKKIISISDNSPKVDFIDKPKSTIKGVLDIDYVFSDDYEVTKLYAKVLLKKPLEFSLINDIRFNIPFQNSDDLQTLGKYYHDLTEHIWAGLPVKITLNAEDYIGQIGQSEIVEILLPEKKFSNLIALSIINQRKNLAWGKEKPFTIGTVIQEILKDDLLGNKFSVAKDWLLQSVEILSKNEEIKSLEKEDFDFVIDLLWKTALFIESGQLAVAENELRKAQEDLQEALQGNEGSDIQDMVSNLDEALKKYLEELENPMDIDVPQVSESDNPGDRGGESGAQANEKENLEEKLNEIADLAASGSLDEAQEQLENMQDMTEALDREALGEALGEEEGTKTPMAMQQISEMMQEQEALMEDSFEQSLNAAQADQKTPGSGPVNAGKEQEILRKQLEDVMHEINESDSPVPEELGRAERAMRQAERELQRGRPDRAQTAQGRAIEELKKAAEKMDKMHSGDGPSQMAGDSGNNNSRDQRDPLGRVPPGQGTSPGGDVGIPKKQNITKAKEIVKELYKKAESSQEGSVERKYVDSLLDWY